MMLATPLRSPLAPHALDRQKCRLASFVPSIKTTTCGLYRAALLRYIDGAEPSGSSEKRLSEASSSVGAQVDESEPKRSRCA